MKHALLKTKSRLIMSLMIVIMSVVYTSCDDTETTDSTKFTIFYSGMTDIGPSMSGRISSPTYKGNTPSDFAITKVTLKGEAYPGDCFTINPNDGFISINSTKDMQVGLYKLSISCISGGNYYEFKDIVEINFLKAVPDGITVEPNKLQVKYNDIIDETSEVELPTAQVKTDGDHVTITKYEIAKSDYSKYFDITKSGKISIIKGSTALLPGIYNISLKLTTGASSEDEGIFENALEINVTSAPFGLEYTPNEDMLEAENDKSGKTSFQSNAPALKGSLEGIVKVTVLSDTVIYNDCIVDRVTEYGKNNRHKVCVNRETAEHEHRINHEAVVNQRNKRKHTCRKTADFLESERNIDNEQYKREQYRNKAL